MSNAAFGRLIGWHRCPECGRNHPQTPPKHWPDTGNSPENAPKTAVGGLIDRTPSLVGVAEVQAPSAPETGKETL